MTLIRSWIDVRPGSGHVGTDAVSNDYVVAVPAGATLLRTMAWASYEEAPILTHFPPDAAVPIALGLYQNLNDAGGALSPGIYDSDVDWIGFYVPQWFADFAVATSTEQDLTYHGWCFLDVKGRRKCIDFHPVLTIATGPIEASPGSGYRLRDFSFGITVRQLWEWND